MMALNPHSDFILSDLGEVPEGRRGSGRLGDGHFIARFSIKRNFPVVFHEGKCYTQSEISSLNKIQKHHTHPKRKI